MANKMFEGIEKTTSQMLLGESQSKHVPYLTKEQLGQFIVDFCDNKIFSSAHMSASEQENLMRMVFMPLALGALSEFTEEEIKQVGLVYEYHSKAMNTRSINGCPIFFSCRILHKKDWDFARPRIVQEMERRQKAKEELLKNL